MAGSQSKEQGWQRLAHARQSSPRQGVGAVQTSRSPTSKPFGSGASIHQAYSPRGSPSPPRELIHFPGSPTRFQRSPGKATGHEPFEGQFSFEDLSNPLTELKTWETSGCLVLFDHSNILLNGRSAYNAKRVWHGGAESAGGATGHCKWTIDPSKLTSEIEKRLLGERFCAGKLAFLSTQHGKERTLWVKSKYEDNGWLTFMSGYTQDPSGKKKELQVDIDLSNTLTQDCVEVYAANRVQYSGTTVEREYILLSGDGGYIHPVKNALKRGFRVTLCAWSTHGCNSYWSKLLDEAVKNKWKFTIEHLEDFDEAIGSVVYTTSPPTSPPTSRATSPPTSPQTSRPTSPLMFRPGSPLTSNPTSTNPAQQMARDFNHTPTPSILSLAPRGQNQERRDTGVYRPPHVRRRVQKFVSRVVTGQDP